jgi:RNA polymerase sigma-70 factor, ECF subfamily
VGLNQRLLLSRLQRGDHRACRELVARYHAGLFGYLRHLGADHHLAEDLTQETYAKAWGKVHTVRESASLRSWLYTIARNEFFAKARVRRPRLTNLEGCPEYPAPDPGILEHLEESERDRHLRRTVLKLEAPLREMIVLHYFQGLSLAEVGSVLGIPGGTVKSRLNRALSELRSLLNDTSHPGSPSPGAGETHGLRTEEGHHVRLETRKTPAGTA